MVLLRPLFSNMQPFVHESSRVLFELPVAASIMVRDEQLLELALLRDRFWAFNIRWLGAKEFDFVWFNLEAGISKRIVNEGQNISDIVVTQREFRHAIIELSAIDN